MSRHIQWFLGAATAAAVADQLTKQWALAALDPGRPVSVIDGYFDWVLSFNTGAAFSMLGGVAGARVALSAVALIAVGALAWSQLSAASMPRLRAIGLGLLAGGAAGNLIDRLHSGKVTDFVLWRYHDHLWPVFNLADVFLFLGVVAVVVDMARRRRAREVPKPDAADALEPHRLIGRTSPEQAEHRVCEAQG